jgi:hypothetical protein
MPLSKKIVWGLAVLSPIALVSVTYVGLSRKIEKLTQAENRARAKDVAELSRAAVGKSDKGFPGHGYTELYERFLHQWRDEPIRIFEIGIADGGSLAMWQAYFSRATLYGVDTDDKSKFETARAKTCIADQTNREQMRKCLDKFGGQFDLVIDEGGHRMRQQQISLGLLFPYVKPGGFYSIEGLHTSMPSIYRGFDVEPDEGNSTLNMIFKYIKSAPGRFESKYMLPDEIQYLSANVESTVLSFADNQGHSMMCIFKKRGAPSNLGRAAAASPPGNGIGPQPTPARTTTGPFLLR